MKINLSEEYVLQATYYNYNFGSVLQCYATQAYFSKNGLKCYLIKINNTGLRKIHSALMRRLEHQILALKYPSIKTEIERQLDSSISSTMRISEDSKKFIDEFFNTRINFIQDSYTSLERLANSNNCKLCVAGSDQIWNAGRVYLESAYFLDFVSQEKRYAFAPSFGVDNVSDFNVKRYGKYINRFERLSAREESGVNLIKELTGRDAELLMDPVFLLNAKEWTDFAKNEEKEELGNYVFAFFLDNPSELARRQIRDLHNRGYKVCSIAYAYEGMKDDGCLLLNGGPEKFVNMINNASVVLTDSFHASAFSVLLYKHFYTFERAYTGTNQSARIKNLLEKTGLSYRYDFQEKIGHELTKVEKKKISLLLAENKKRVDCYFGLNI